MCLTALIADAVVLTQQVSGEVDGQDDADWEDADYNQQADDVTLEGQIVDGVLTTLLPDLFIPAGGGGGGWVNQVLIGPNSW